MEWFKKIWETVKKAWSGWGLVQKLILGGIVAAVIVGIVLLVGVSSSPSMVPLLTSAITDQDQIVRITNRLDEENVMNRVTGGIIYVENDNVARQMRAILVREDLIPQDTDPWAIMDMERWTLTDFERDVNLQRAITESLEQHLESLEDIDSADVNLVIPEESLFASEQNPTTASVIITPKPGSDITENRVKVEGIVKLIQFAVEGLTGENIVVSDISGRHLNDFEGLERVDRLEITDRMLKQKTALEARYMSQILRELQGIFTSKRIRIVNMDIDLEFVNKKVQTEEHFPIEMVPEDPSTPYPDREVVQTFTESEQTVTESFQGTGFNPEGPPGQEGQTPAQYQDLTNLVGNYSKDDQITNYVYNTQTSEEEMAPYEIARVSVAVAIDGVWTLARDDKGEYIFEEGTLKRSYEPVSDELLAKAQRLVEHSVGYDANRGDTVTVQHIPFDRSEEFKQQDEEYLRQKQIQRMLFYSIVALVGVIVFFIAFRLISREMERRRRQREEELARQHQAMREQALRNAEEEGIDVEMSVQERARLELQENAMNMAREHPEDVAKLIRTWLAEEN
ncbi:MAG: flagellar basal-body MS-ring/collar protein FliF [Spirochaetales bacterium]|nr:flagellar basal-body MS-ring/collar protein FliF [Spirochaetales bacterium]